MTLRLPVGEVTVLLGPSPARRRLMAALDDDGARCASGHEGLQVLRLAAAPADDLGQRRAAVHRARHACAPVVLVDRLTDGLPAADRRTLLGELRAVAADGRAVLVDDVDPVAALAVADGALRTRADGGTAVERPTDPDYLAS